MLYYIKNEIINLYLINHYILNIIFCYIILRMKTIIWENKGIVLGIILFILNNYNKVKNRLIIIRNERYKFILERLFPKIEFAYSNKYNILDKKPFDISVRDSNKNGLIITNINSLDQINGIPMLLPWYDKYNPIIMFLYNEDKVRNKDKIVKKINKFTVNDRRKPYGPVNFIEVLCKIKIWDTDFEHYVLERLWRKFHYSKVSMYEFISDVLKEGPCRQVASVVKYPVVYEKIVEKPVPIIHTLIKEVEVEIDRVKDDKGPEYEGLIDLLNQKLIILNSIFNSKHMNQQ